MADHQRSAVPTHDLRTNQQVHSYKFSLAADGTARSLATLDLGFFTAAGDPAGVTSSFAIRRIKVRNSDLSVNRIKVGGSWGQEFAVLPDRDTDWIEINDLAAIFVKNDGAAAATVEVFFETRATG